MNKGIKLLVIDYLQLITGDAKYNYNETKLVGDISNQLKALSKELDIPVIALSQLSRKIEERKLSERYPILSDLRQTGEIEQDADMVMFITNFAMYGIKGFQGEDVKNCIMLDVAKNRHGKLKQFLLKYTPNHMRYYTDNLSGFSTIENKKEEEEINKALDF